MRFSALSVTEAEHLIARFWFLLEKHQIASPRVVTKPQSDGLQVEFHFRYTDNEDLIASELGCSPAAAR